MIADMEANKKLSPIVAELFSGKKHFTCVYITVLFQSA